ncbi:CLUMA_CG002750, isoform A [Clunio marinus]|uniref:CLUMA_CG002750, isoform A n=1 Tax=Clunio marinus TaxID=568069 RepID=A0A1J1HQX5_9DIPT|nr:CLUMA_CG002750, isoform A [Clunio marinus]
MHMTDENILRRVKIVFALIVDSLRLMNFQLISKKKYICDMGNEDQKELTMSAVVEKFLSHYNSQDVFSKSLN